MDAIRYSRSGVGGSSRFIAMGGAFGAVGADLGCAAFNPAGLGIFRKGEISFSGSLRLTNNSANIYNTNTQVSDVKFAFNNFGIAYAFPSTQDPESRHVIAFNNSQLQNFNSSTSMSGNTNSTSIARDMQIQADKVGNVDNLNYSYEGMGYSTYILDNDGSKFYSLVDTKGTVLQTRDIVTSGRLNESNFSYAYSYKDKYYFGASIGVPRVNFTSTTSHFESDVNDKMQILWDAAGATYTTTYNEDIPSLDPDYVNRNGFKSLTYTEYFQTKGSGLNLKLGGIARVTDAIRVGGYFHTPTIYFLNDTYYNTMSASFDKKPNSPDTYKNPDKGGYYEYRIITPARVSLNSAFIIKKMAVIGLDYELVNYASAKLLGEKATTFSSVNTTIKSKYTLGHNIRLGGELNIKPVMIRAGYTMSGSPFGDVFTGDFVRHTVSFGLGIRTDSKWYFDIFWSKSLTTEEYYLFTALDTKAKLSLNAASLGASVGIKF